MTFRDSPALLPGSEEKKRMGKGRRKSWVRSFGRIFRRKTIHNSPSARRFLEAEVQTSSRDLHDEQEEIETADGEIDGNMMESRGGHHKKRPFERVSTGHWSSADDAPVARCSYSGIHQLKSAGRVHRDEMDEHRITGLRRSSNTTDAATTICQCRQIPQERKPSNAHTLFFRHEDISAEAEQAHALDEEKATRHPSIARDARPQKIPRGKIIYSKAGGNDEDTVSFAVSLNDSLMKEVLNSIQEGNIHGGLTKNGQRCTSRKDFKGKCIASKRADDSSETFSVEIELCDPPEKNGGNNSGGAESNAKDVEDNSSSDNSPPESTDTKEISENEVHKKEDSKSREGALPERGRFTIESTTSSDSTLGSHSSYTNEVSKEEVESARDFSRAGLEPVNGGPSVGQKSKKTSVGSSLNTVQPEEDSWSDDNDDPEATTPSKRMGVPQGKENYRKDRHELHTDRSRGKEIVQNHNRSKDKREGETLDRKKKGRKVRTKGLPSNSSTEHRTSSSRTKGRRSKRLRGSAELEIRALVKPSRKRRSTCCSCMGNRNIQSTSSQGTESISAMSGRESGVDTMSDDGCHSSNDFNGNDDKRNAFYRSGDGGRSWNSYSGSKDEEDTWTMSDDGIHSKKNCNGKSKTVPGSGLKVAKRAEWNLNKSATEAAKTTGVDSKRVAAGIRKYQNSYRNIDPSDDSTHHSFDEARDDGDAFVRVSRMTEYLDSKDYCVQFENICDRDYSGNPPAQRRRHKPNKKTRGCNLRDREDTDSDPEQSRGLSSEPLYQDWNASTRETCDLEEGRLEEEEEEQIDQGPKNKWLQRMGKVSVAQALDDYGTQDRKRFMQQESNGSLSEGPPDCYLQCDGARGWDEKRPTNPECNFSHSWQHHTGVKPSDQHLQAPTGGCTDEDVQTATLEWNGFLPQDDVGCLGDEWLTRLSDQHLAWKGDSKNLETPNLTASSTKQHTGNRESVAETLKASQSLLQGNVPRKHQCDYSGCCHVQSRLNVQESVPSPTKGGKLRKNLFIMKTGACSPSSTSALKYNKVEERAAQFSQGDSVGEALRDDNRPPHDDHSRPNVSRTVTHAGPRMKQRCIPRAIEDGTRETLKHEVDEASCRHEYINEECEDGSMSSGESKRTRKDKTSIANHEGDLKRAQNRFHICSLHKLPSNHLDDLKQKEAIWKKCQKRQEAMLERIEKMSATAKSCVMKNSNVGADSNQLDKKFQNGLTDSNAADKNSTQSNVQFQNLPSSSPKHSQQEGKTLPGTPKPRGRSISARAGRNFIFPKNAVKRIFKRNDSEDSSSDDDIYDQASRQFRDELFKRIPGKDVQCFNSSSQVLTVGCGDCSDLETRKKVEEVQRHLQALSSSDAFRFSSVYKELLRVEDEMKEIAKAFASYAHPEQTDFIGALENSGNSRQGRQPWKCTGRESKRQLSCQDGGSELVDESSPELEGRSTVLIYKNPLWSKWIGPKTTSCGDPLSVQMAARLINAEVPIDYENGYKVQYIPVDKRGRMGMRDRPPGWEEPNRLWLQPVHEERAKPPKNTRRSVDSSSSSSPCQEEENMKALQALTSDPNYESSSSNSGSELLHRRHRRRVSKEAIRIRKQRRRGEDSDSSNSSFWSEGDNPNLGLFVGEAEEQLGRLKLAKGRHGKRAMSKKSGCPIASNLPLKKLTARELKEFHLLERRVQRELGAAGRNKNPTKCPLQGGSRRKLTY